MNRFGAPTTYKRITPDRGCGFILARLAELDDSHFGPGLTKEDVYLGTPWCHRPGFASLLWSAMLEDGLIESEDGMVEYNGCLSPGARKCRRYSRANGHYELGRGWTVRYHLTPKGRGILIDMLERRVLQKADKMAFCERNGIEFDTGRTLNTVGSVAEYDAKKDAIPAPSNPIERDILEKEAVHCAKLAAHYVGENQKLRAEKNDLNERIKKLVGRLEWLENEISDVKSVLNEIIG